MSCRVVAFGVAVVWVGVLSSPGCSGRPARIHPPKLNASEAASAAMKQYDTDRDGKIAGEELDKAPSLKQALENLDADGDQAVSAGEIKARIDHWHETGLGRMSTICTITKGGKPLEGATVTFEPEKFLGDTYVDATGTSDEHGKVMVSIPTSGQTGPPGVPPGVYLVRITHPTVEIPAKFNTETTLGQEVAVDAGELSQGLTYDIE